MNAINQVSIGSEVSGTIKSINVDFNSVVKAGQVLATLDPTTYQAAENSAQASLDLAKASLNSASRTGKKMMDLVDMANQTLKRDVDLLNKGLVNENQVDLDRTAAETARAGLPCFPSPNPSCDFTGEHCSRPIATISIQPVEDNNSKPL